MSISFIAGENIVAGSISMQGRYGSGNPGDNAFTLGYWQDYRSGSAHYKSCRSSYAFTLSRPCSSVSIALQFSDVDGNVETRNFYAAISDSRVWEGLSAEDTQTFSHGDGYTAQFTVSRVTPLPAGTYYILLWSNSGGNSGAVGARYNAGTYGSCEVTISAAAAQGVAKIYNGSAFADYNMKIFDGTGWTDCDPYIYDGTSWQKFGG